MKLAISLTLLAILALSQSTWAQVYLRTEMVDKFPVQIYGATVTVKIKGKKETALDKAKLKRQDAYEKMKKQVSELVRSRISSLTTITNSETTDKSTNSKEDQSHFEQKYNETTKSASASFIEIKPIHETIEKKKLITEIELWVSPIPIISFTTDQFPEELTPSEMFDLIHISNGQKYLVALKKDLIFEDGLRYIAFWKDVYKAHQVCQADFPEDLDESFFYRSNNQGIVTFTNGTFTGEVLIVYSSINGLSYASVFLIIHRDEQLFSMRLFTRRSNDLPTISEMINMIKNNRVGSAGFDDYFSIMPVMESITPRVIRDTVVEK